MRRLGSKTAVLHSEEWVGGYFSLNGQVTGEGPAYQPSLAVWIEPRGPLVVKGKVVRPGEERAALLRLLGEAFTSPEVGPPRRPARVRVADEELARRIRERHAMPTIVGPTPELNEMREAMAAFEAERAADESARANDDTYLPPGASSELVADLFARARALHALEPWKNAGDEDVFAVDVPEMDIRGGVLSLIGSLGESTGFLMFASAADFRVFYRAATARLSRTRGRDAPEVDFGGEVMSLTFERGADLPHRMRKQVAQHGWQVPSPEAYPRVERRDRSGASLPTRVDDLRLADAITGALVAFASKHGLEIGAPTNVVSLESRTDAGPVVVLTYPHPDFLAGFEDEDGGHEPVAPPPRASVVSRNAPCPCGSGLKYKRCCLRKDEAAPAASAAPGRGKSQQFEAALIGEILRFGRARFPDALDRARRTYGLADDADPVHQQLFVPWLVYSYRIADGEPLASHFLRQWGSRLDSDHRLWLERQLRGRLSVWEVEEVRRGEGLTVVDLLTGKRQQVLEKPHAAASKRV